MLAVFEQFAEEQERALTVSAEALRTARRPADIRKALRDMDAGLLRWEAWLSSRSKRAFEIAERAADAGSGISAAAEALPLAICTGLLLAISFIKGTSGLRSK